MSVSSTEPGRLQNQLLESLGISLLGYAPAGYVGRGCVRFESEELQNRLLLAGFQGVELKSYILGDRSMTIRTLFKLARAARGTDRSVYSDTRIEVTVVDMVQP
jgi:hypothetical protein